MRRDPKRQQGERRTYEAFWVVRKAEPATIVEGHQSNSIRTSYELLWAEVRNSNRSSLTI